MYTTRWKLTAGLLGVSLCGLAAVANSTGRAGSPLGCYKADEKPFSISIGAPPKPTIAKGTSDAVRTAYNPPIDLPPLSPPVVDTTPTLPSPATIPLADIPVMPSVPVPNISPFPQVDLQIPVINVPTISPVSTPQATAIPVVSVPIISHEPAVVVPTPLIVSVVQTPSPKSPSNEPRVTGFNFSTTPPVNSTPTWAPQTTAPAPSSMMMLREFPGQKSASQVPAVPELSSPELIPAPKKLLPTPPSSDDGIKVVVRMTSGRPSLAILSDGAEMLTLTCEQLDLAARGPGDDSVSAIKASGKVTFTAPGCQGQCDELVLNPKSWDGSMLKNVRVKCSQGRGDSELTADKMTFKLRSPRDVVVPTVAMSHSEPARKD